jgi:shikimate 5-dehydrogenase
MVVVNATPLGMQGEELPSCALDGAVGLFDMAYGATTTPAVRRAKERGIPVVAGEQMLLGQAMASFQLWTGRRAPEDAMRRALDASMASREASH